MKLNSINRYSKILKNTAKRAMFGVNLKPNIRHMAFELTNLCNSKCDMCHIWANKDDSNILSTNDIRDIFSDESLRDIEDVLLTGGEMYMRDDIPEIIRIINNNNPKTRIFTSTNGLLHEIILANAEESAKDGIVVNYGISIDALGDKHDQRRRAPGNFEIIDRKLIPGLKSLQKKYPNAITLTVGQCMDNFGLDNFEDVRKYCENKDISFMSQMIEDFDYYVVEKKRKRKVSGWEHMLETKNGTEGKNRLLRKNAYGALDKRYSTAIKKLMPTVHHYRLLSMLRGRDLRYECSSMRNFFLLRYDGKMTPCLRFADWEVGDLKKNTLKEVFLTKNYKDSVQAILQCDGCLNTWCTDWSMEMNAMPFYKEVLKWLPTKIFRSKKYKRMYISENNIKSGSIEVHNSQNTS